MCYNISLIFSGLLGLNLWVGLDIVTHVLCQPSNHTVVATNSATLAQQVVPSRCSGFQVCVSLHPPYREIHEVAPIAGFMK